jgi:hypothetical protein
LCWDWDFNEHMDLPPRLFAFIQQKDALCFSVDTHLLVFHCVAFNIILLGCLISS